MGSTGIDGKRESLVSSQSEMYLRNKGLTTDSREKCPPQPSVCHPDREAYKCHRICRPCYDRIRHQGERGRAKVWEDVASSNPTMSEAFRAEVAERIGAVKEYERKSESERKELNTNKPTVREHAAKVAILHNLDFRETAKELKPNLPPVDQAELAQTLEHDPKLSREIQSQLSARGLSDNDRDYFVKRLWEMFESSDPRQEAKALAAMRILGRAFISDKVENVQVEKLQLIGLEEGLKRMTSDTSAQDTSGFESAGLKPAKLDAFDDGEWEE